MKTLKITYLALLGLGLIALAYNYLVIQPELPSFDQLDFEYMVKHPEVEAAYSHARHTSDLLGLSGTALAGLGTILAFAAFIKSKVGLHLVFALVGVVVAVLSCLVAFAHVM